MNFTKGPLYKFLYDLGYLSCYTDLVNENSEFRINFEPLNRTRVFSCYVLQEDGTDMYLISMIRNMIFTFPPIICPEDVVYQESVKYPLFKFFFASGVLTYYQYCMVTRLMLKLDVGFFCREIDTKLLLNDGPDMYILAMIRELYGSNQKDKIEKGTGESNSGRPYCVS